MSGKDFIRFTRSQDRSDLRKALSGAIVHFLEQNRAVYLDGLGILYPCQQKRSVTRDISSLQSFVRTETVSSAAFEKCYDLIQLHRDRFPKIAEIPELKDYIYPRLSIDAQIQWNEEDLSRLLRGLVRSIKDEIVIDGSSYQLKAVGRFLALHNRQGSTPEDWFAGSDIFLQSHFEEPVSVEAGRLFAKPVLRDAWELLEAGHGAPCYQFEINLKRELAKLGYDCEPIAEAFGAYALKIPVSVFRVPASQGGEEDVLLYCTNGLRSFQSEGEGVVGTELTFQLAVQKEDFTDERVQTSSQSAIPEWPARVLSLGWILLVSSKERRVRPGAGLSADMPLIPQFDTGLTGIFATPFEAVSSAQRTESGVFEYVNLVGITDEETAVAASNGSDQLALLSQFKKLDQITRPTRASVTSKTGLRGSAV
jgi:hypothetical protein